MVTTGLDAHQNYVLTRAEREGVEVGVMMADFRADIQDTYGLAPDRVRLLQRSARPTSMHRSSGS